MPMVCYKCIFLKFQVNEFNFRHRLKTIFEKRVKIHFEQELSKLKKIPLCELDNNLANMFFCAKIQNQISVPFSTLAIQKCCTICKLKKNPVKGSDILSLCFVVPCTNGYATYCLMPQQICLKYFQGPVSFSTAQTKCQAEEADLIKIDSREKYEIFKDYHGMFELCNRIQIRLFNENKISINGRISA